MAKKLKKTAGGRTGGGKSGAPRSTASLIVMALVVVFVGVAGGVLGWLVVKGGDDPASNGSKVAGSGGALPDYVYGAKVPKGTAEAYQFAVANQDVLKYIPCYCGCGELDGHDSNLDCFIKSGSGDNIVFDKHAAG